MYSGLLPKGLTEDDLSPDEEEDAAEEEREGEKRRVSAEKLSSAGENTAVPPTEAPWTHTASDGGSDPATSGMPGVSHEMWQVCAPCSELKGTCSLLNTSWLSCAWDKSRLQ